MGYLWTSETTQDFGYIFSTPEAQDSVRYLQVPFADAGVFSFVSCTTRHGRGLGRKGTGPLVQQQASEQTGVEPVVDMRIIPGPLGR